MGRRRALSRMPAHARSFSRALGAAPGGPPPLLPPPGAQLAYKGAAWVAPLAPEKPEAAPVALAPLLAAAHSVEVPTWLPSDALRSSEPLHSLAVSRLPLSVWALPLASEESSRSLCRLSLRSICPGRSTIVGKRADAMFSCLRL